MKKQFVAVTGVEPAPLESCAYLLHHTAPIYLSSSMTPARGTHLLGIISHFQALSAIITPMRYAASLYSLSKSYVNKSKSRFVGGRGRNRTSFISNVHQSSVVVRASPMRPFRVGVFPPRHPRASDVLPYRLCFM